MNALDDPFASVRLQKPHRHREIEQPRRSLQNEKIQESHNESNENDPFESVRVKKVEGFPGLYEGGRHLARIGSRVAETIGGIPGDFQDLIQSGVFNGLEKLVGHKVTPELREEARIKSERAPTSRELKKISQEKSDGLTTPQNAAEESSDEFVETLSSLLGPMKFRKSLGVAAGSQLVKEGLNILGTEKETQEAGKLGTMFFLTMLNPGSAMKFASSQYDKANKLAKGASINVSKLESNLKNLNEDLIKGVTTSEKNTVLRPINELLEKSKSGKLAVDELTAAKRDINKLMGEPDTLKGAKKLLKVVGKHVDDAIKPYEKINPAFSKAYRPANEIFGAVMQGNKVANTVKNVLGGKSVLGAVAGEAILGHPEMIPATIAGASGALGTAKGIDFVMRLGKSPELQKFYSKAMAAAAKEDIGALRFYSNKIDELMEKD